MDYDIILVTVEDNLVHTKSGSKVSRNIADFMPDYNLWYAIKFCDVKEIWIVENNNYSLKYMSLTAWETRYSFIEIWLSQIIEKTCHKMYSVKGNWIPGWSQGGEEIPDLIKRWTKESGKILFIDKDSRENEDYIGTKNFLDYITKSEFIKKYNKNPRIYEKNSDINK